MTPDLLNFKKGWMSKLDDDGEWRKHWFVLTDASLRYYRDARAEEKEDLDGEIDLRSCVEVSEFDVEKNYGFQIQTQGAAFTLSAMTSGIRRNWLEVLRKNVLPSSSPDIMQLSDSRTDKIHTSCPLLPGQLPSQHGHRDSGSEVMAPTPHQLDYVELAPVMDTQAPTKPISTPETREGLDREQARRLEDRARWFQAGVPAKEPPPGSSLWDAVHLKKGTGSASSLEETLERKWVEFERLPLREMRSLPPVGSCGSRPANEVLLKEVALLKAQVEQLQKVRFAREGGKCGLEAPCGRSLEAMEKAHGGALEELQRRHERQVRELEVERDRLLREEAQATVQAMEVLKTALRVELEEEVARARRLGGGTAELQAMPQTQSERQAQQRELDSLSERYSQKCLELRRAEERHREMEREASRKETELEQLKKENRDLQSHMMKEISHLRSSSECEGSDRVLHDGHECSSCELEVLLRVKENEVQYLHKEIGCLRDELLSLSKEKRLAYERCKEANVELNAAKSRSERELEALREHLRLAMAALREGQELGNSMSH
ncbi:TRIO and F-actin-binding protein-like isoform X2 [Brienomyrus brachyistius]|uniref:TRIO and F-actin-binding protein-like isoform X2 n=1 Tax=Brienomyrus brachyistius TaxID=42636 RepID=UPI0020B2B70C|nr:TRIO and F-actin-binding protein-like isoform X2 [Brienomyrus brachyistius]